MYFVGLVLLIAVGTSVARGGRFAALAHAERRGGWLLFAGVSLQVTADAVVAFGWLQAGSLPTYLLILASQLTVLAWLLMNRSLPGIILVAIGLALNAAVMAANGGMPVDPEAIVAIGQHPSELVHGKHVLLDASTRLAWLADIWPIPMIRSIISLGDVVLAAGLVPLTHALMTAHRRDGLRNPDTSDRDVSG